MSIIDPRDPTPITSTNERQKEEVPKQTIREVYPVIPAGYGWGVPSSQFYRLLRKASTEQIINP
tara:strand:+ start:878 stop:1069 length:192 start_codon:yes stop_codon:yes gene_type:complete